mgnify:CR=1 FL=1
MSALAATLVVLLLAAAGRPRRHRPTPAASTPPEVLRLRPRARDRAIEQALPDAIDAIVLAVRAGYLPAAALQAALPHLHPVLQPPLRDVVERTRAGTRFADALAILPSQLGPQVAPLADSFAAADRDGLPLAPVLERLADEARQRRRRLADARARQLPVRMAVPLVLCTLPSFVFLAVVPLLLAALSSLQR